MAATGRKRTSDKFWELRLRIIVDHPGWSEERARAEIIRAQLGQGKYQKLGRKVRS